MLPAGRTRAQTPYPFTLGVASGEPSPDGFVLWTRLAPEPLAPDGAGGLSAPVPVFWEVFAEEAGQRPVMSGEATAEPGLGHSVHVEVEGLQPGRPYWYRFTALGAQSPLGRTKTAPGPGGLEPLKLCIASCAHYEVGWFSAYRHMAAENPDLVLFLGDYIYEYSYRPTREGLVRRYDRQEEAVSLAGYRNRYALHRMDRDLAALHATAPALVTWDDHEVHNDYSGAHAAISSWTAERFSARRAAAYQAFYEHMPLRRRARPVAGTMRLFERFRFGDLAEITVLDGRQHRSRQACPRGGNARGHVAAETCPDFSDPERTFLGAEQEAWVGDGFRKAAARWNLIAQPLLFSPYLQKAPDGTLGQYTDSWSGYGRSRDRLIEAMTGSGLSNPVVFGGDAHCFIAADIRADYRREGASAVASEFVGTSITSDKMPDVFGETLGLNPHVGFFANEHRGYISATLHPSRLETRFRAISDRTDPRASVSTLAAFAVEAGRPGVIRA